MDEKINFYLETIGSWKESIEKNIGESTSGIQDNDSIDVCKIKVAEISAMKAHHSTLSIVEEWFEELKNGESKSFANICLPNEFGQSAKGVSVINEGKN